jgi:uncharacterized membrane protein YphA (DoxX/SURF4 family)
MNFRNRYLVIVIRILLGLIMLASGISGLLMGNSTQGVPEQMVAFTQVFWASGIFQMVKVTEIVAGFMLVFGIFPALATLFLAPDVVGIVIVNARLIPSFLWLGGIVFVLTAYLGYAYWDKVQVNLHTQLARSLLMAAPCTKPPDPFFRPVSTSGSRVTP